MSINKDNIWNYIIHVDDKHVLFFDGNLNLVEVWDRKVLDGNIEEMIGVEKDGK